MDDSKRRLLTLAEEVFGNPEGPHKYDTLQSLSAGTIAMIREEEPCEMCDGQGFTMEATLGGYVETECRNCVAGE